MAARGWKLEGDEIRWRGHLWYKGDRADIKAYLKRCKVRYPGESPGIILGLGQEEKKFKKGGPWRFTYTDGEVKIVHTQRKADAMAVERHRLQRKTLPRGTVVEIAD
jgi:hypothetical protein